MQKILLHILVDLLPADDVGKKIEEDADVTVYAKDPTGKVWTFQLGQRRSIDLYVDQMHLMGTWTIYASISNDAGTYSGASGGPYVKVSVISPF